VRAFVLSVVVAASAVAGEHARYDVTLSVDRDARSADGHARITLLPAASTRTSFYLWRYPERFAARDKRLNDYNFYWVYPRSFNPGGMRNGAVTVDGEAADVEVVDHKFAGKQTLLRVTPRRPIAPGARAVVDVDLHLQIPTRYGPFGCVHSVCTLTGFYPMLPSQDEAGEPLLDAPPARADQKITVGVTRVSDVVIDGELRAVERGGRTTLERENARPAVVIVSKPRYRSIEASHRGQKIVYLTADLKGIPPTGVEVLPYQPTDRTFRVVDAAKSALDLLAELGVPMAPGHTLYLVQGQERMELALPLGHSVLVSDQIFDIFPHARFLKFHEFQLVRALYDNWVDELIAPRERAADIGWSPDVAASYLMDLYTLRSYRKEEFARQILSWAAFIPAIDRILYAPQVPFATAYFYSLDDPDALRDSLRQFNNDLPTGKTIYTKLRDLVGDKGIDQIVRRQLAGEPLRQAAEAVRGETLDWFFKQWLGPYPPVDYRFVDVRSVKHPGGVTVTAVVEKRGQNPPVEPVEVAARDKKGHRDVQKWDGQGARHSYVFELGAPLETIEIDPRGRLVERLPKSNDDLRFDDRRPARWKFIYNNFGGLVYFFPTLGIDLSLDFSLAPILDLKNSMRFVIYHTNATDIGVSADYARSFGRKITEARLSSALDVSLSAARINASFGEATGNVAHPGTQIGLGVGVGYDDRLFVWEPNKALSLDVSAGAVMTVLDSGRVLLQGTLSAGWESIVPIADGHGLALTAAGAITGGDLSIARQMLAAGGAAGLRGYAIDELLGRGRVVARAEYRHVFVHDLDINILHSLYIRGVGGGVFAEAAMVTACNSYAVDKSSFAYDVGYTLRIFADWFGVSQTTLNIDIAVPLTRQQRDCFGPLPAPSTRAPLGFYFAFGPPW
jgi:hypothetical protein